MDDNRTVKLHVFGDFNANGDMSTAATSSSG